MVSHIPLTIDTLRGEARNGYLKVYRNIRVPS